MANDCDDTSRLLFRAPHRLLHSVIFIFFARRFPK